MKIASGIDLIFIPRFKKSLKNGGQNFLARVFLKEELENRQIEHLAGIFAAKEAIIKALGIPSDSWHDIKINYERSGRPKVEILNFHISLLNSSLSVSHDGAYVVAYFAVLLP